MMHYSYIVRLAGLAAIYILTGLIGLEIDNVSHVATLVWPPAGISLAALLLFGYRMWPAVSIGAFTVNFVATASLWIAAMIGIGNTLEAILGAYLLKHLFDFRNSLEREVDV